MSIASEIVRLGTLRDTIRDKLIAAGIISNASAKLDECATAIDGMTVNSKVSKVLDTSTTSVAIPKGYHKEVGTISILPQEKTQAIISGSVTVTPDNGKVLKKVTVNGPTSYADTTQFASAVTQDDENTYFGVPNAGYYNAGSKIAAKNSNLSSEIDITNITDINATDNQNYSYTYNATEKITCLIYSFGCNDGEWGKCINNFSTTGTILMQKKHLNYLNSAGSFVAVIKLEAGQTVTITSQNYRNGFMFHHIMRLI